MINIPENHSTKESEEVSKLVERVVNALSCNDEFISWRQSDVHPLDRVYEVCNLFVRKGYHAKINFFIDGRSAYQCFVISKNRCIETSARMVYSEIIG